MTARQGLTVAGQVIGAYFGGPIGAAVGGAIGGYIGGNIDGPQQGPRLDDTSAPAVEFGAKVSRVYGRVWCTLSPLWWSRLRESTANSGGKGAADQTTDNFVYHCDMLGRLADGSNVVDWTRIRIDGKIVATQLASSSADSLIATANTEQWGHFELRSGSPTQTPWSVLEAAVGAGNASAYRDQCTGAFTNLLMPNGRNPSLIEVEVVTAATGEFSISGIGSVTGIGKSPTLPEDAVAGDGLLLYVMHQNIAAVPVVGSGWGTHITSTSDSSSSMGLSVFGRLADGTGNDAVMDFTITGDGECTWGVMVLHGLNDSRFPSGLIGAGSDFNTAEEGGSGINPGDIIKASSGAQLVIACAVLVAENGDAVASISSVPTGYVQFGPDPVTAPIYREVSVFGSYHAQMGLAYKTITGATENPDAFGDNGGNYGGGGSCAMTLALSYNVVAGITPLPVDLQDVLEAEMLRCAPLTSAHIDMSAAAGKEVWGFKASRSAAAECGVLLDWYYLDIFCGEKITVVERGGAVEQVIPYGYTGSGRESAGDPFAGLTRGADVESQFATAVQYINILADGEVDTQQGQRVGTGSEVRAVNFSIYSKPTLAKGRADTITQDTRVAAHTATVHLGARQAASIQPGSVLTLVDNKGNSYRTRVLRLVWNQGVYDVDVCLDDPNILKSVGITTEVDTSVIEVDPPAVAEFLPLDIPRVSDAQNAPGYLALVKTNDATSARWFDSPDDVTYSARFDFANDAVFGRVTAASGSFDQGVLFDEGSSLTVDVGDGELASATREALLDNRGLNLFAVGLAGRMVLGQFRTRTQVSAGVYTLSGFVNMGDKGTEQYCASIAAGDDFAMLGIPGTAQIPRSITDLGVPVHVKAVAFGANADNVTAVDFTANGVNVKPLSPVLLRAERDASTGDIEISWTRRTFMDTRFGGDLGDAYPLGVSTEKYRARLFTDGTYTTLKRDLGTPTTSSVTYTAVDRATDGHTLTSPLFVRITMVGDAVSEGYPLQAAA